MTKLMSYLIKLLVRYDSCSPSLNQLISCGRAGVKEHCKVRSFPSVTQVGGKVFKKWASCSRFKPKRDKKSIVPAVHKHLDCTCGIITAF